MISPYQPIDIILGKTRCEIPPKPGFVITAPDSRLDARMFLTMKEAERGLADMKALSRWPDHLFIRPAWIHEQELVYGQVTNRRHWTPQ